VAARRQGARRDLLIPAIDELVWVDLRIITLTIPLEEIITNDTTTVLSTLREKVVESNGAARAGG